MLNFPGTLPFLRNFRLIVNGNNVVPMTNHKKMLSNNVHSVNYINPV